MRAPVALLSLLRSRPRSALGAAIVVALGAAVAISGGSGPSTEPRPDAAAESGSPPNRSVRTSVLHVVDGDTIVVSLDGAEERVRYIGIDTPETEKPGQPLECYADEARERNEELVEGTSVGLEFDRELRDRFGRLLAYVEVGGLQINEALVRDGFARTLTIEPNTSRAEQLAILEVDAARAGRGLWGACGR